MNDKDCNCGYRGLRRPDFQYQLPWVLPAEPESIWKIFFTHGARVSFPRHATLTHGGVDGKVYLVVKGLVTFGYLDINHKFQIICVVLPGSTVGDLDSLDPTPCSILAETVKPTELLCIPRDVWLDELRSSVCLMEDYAKSANFKHQCTMAGMIANYTQPLEQRLRLLLFSLIQSYYPLKPDDWNPLPVKLSVTEIASIVATNRCWCSRTFSKWTELGLIDKSGGYIRIHGRLLKEFKDDFSSNQIFRQSEKT